MYYNKKFVLDYLEALDREIFDLYRGEKLETIYIGGGTPSCLSLEELDNVLVGYKIQDPEGHPFKESDMYREKHKKILDNHLTVCYYRSTI